MPAIMMQDPMVPGALSVTRTALWEGHRDSLFALTAQPENPWLFTSGGDGWIMAWNAHKPMAAGRVLARMTGTCYALTTDPQSGLLVAGQNGEGLRVFVITGGVEEEALTLTLVGTLPLPGATVFDLLTLAPGEFLAALGDGRLVWLKVEGNLREDASSLSDTDAPQPAVSIQSRIIPLADKALRVLTAGPPPRVGHPTGAEERPALLAVGASDGWIRWLDGATLEVIAAVQAHEPSVFALACMPSGSWLSGGRDARLRLWPAPVVGASDAPVALKEIPAHLATINGLALAPGGRMIASAGRDRTIKIWDTANLALIKVIDRARFGGHTGSVNRLGWAGAGGRLLVTCSDDRTARLWSLAEGPPAR